MRENGWENCRLKGDSWCRAREARPSIEIIESNQGRLGVRCDETDWRGALALQTIRQIIRDYGRKISNERLRVENRRHVCYTRTLTLARQPFTFLFFFCLPLSRNQAEAHDLELIRKKRGKGGGERGRAKSTGTRSIDSARGKKSAVDRNVSAISRRMAAPEFEKKKLRSYFIARDIALKKKKKERRGLRSRLVDATSRKRRFEWRSDDAVARYRRKTRALADRALETFHVEPLPPVSGTSKHSRECG